MLVGGGSVEPLVEGRGAGHTGEHAAGAKELLVHCVLRRELRELLGGLALDCQLGEVLFVVRQGRLDRANSRVGKKSQKNPS